mmetsp:Transcript_23810/g.54521  ORF Transcript_23810/g.54521 Transcript_23810/m.54521 type:complete len:1402 (-) Transcript_23810:247-4452(-)
MQTSLGDCAAAGDDEDSDDCSAYTTASKLEDRGLFGGRTKTNGKSYEPLRPGDEIMYTPAISVAGTNYKRAKVLSVSPSLDCPLVLSTNDVLAMRHQVKRISVIKPGGGMVDHSGIYRCIEEFQLEEGGTITHGDVNALQATEYAGKFEDMQRKIMNEADDFYGKRRRTNALHLGLSDKDVDAYDPIYEEERREAEQWSRDAKARHADLLARINQKSPTSSSSSSDDELVDNRNAPRARSLPPSPALDLELDVSDDDSPASGSPRVELSEVLDSKQAAVTNFDDSTDVDFSAKVNASYLEQAPPTNFDVVDADVNKGGDVTDELKPAAVINCDDFDKTADVTAADPEPSVTNFDEAAVNGDMDVDNDVDVGDADLNKGAVDVTEERLPSYAASSLLSKPKRPLEQFREEKRSSSMCTFAQMSSDQIHDLLDEKASDDRQRWTGEIWMDVWPWKKGMAKESIYASDPIRMNLCGEVNNPNRAWERLYLSTEYIPGINQTRTYKNDRVYLDLVRASVNGRCPIVANGGGKKYRDLVCRDFNRRPCQKSRGDDAVNYRSTSLTNDRRNNRKLGKSEPRRRHQADTSNGVCSFLLKQRWDEVGHYIDLSSGCGSHCNHARPINSDVISMPTKLLSDDAKHNAMDATDAGASKAVGRNFVLKNTGHYISRAKVAYLKQCGSESMEDDISQMIDSFESNPDIKFTALSDIPLSDLREPTKRASTEVSNGTVTVSTSKDEDGNISTTEVTDIPNMAHTECTAKTERSQRGLESFQVLFMAIGWVFLPMLRFVKLCPEVIWCDITSHSNNKGFHLMTFSCRNTSINKQSVFMYLWIPNQTRFSFRWVFQHAIAILLPEHVRLRVRLIMKDGDPQQRNEILVCLLKVFPNAIEGGCGWHIIDRGWDSHITARIERKHRELWKKVVKKIHSWMYSWMKPRYVENEDEYQVSKILLIRFVCSEVVLNAARGNRSLIIDILRFIRGHVLVHEELYLYYRRKHVLHFETSHGVQHEGTNTAAKEHSAGVKGTMSMNLSANTLGFQAELKLRELEDIIARDFHKRDKTWSSSSTAKSLTTFGEGLMVEVNKRIPLHEAKRVGPREFEVTYLGPGKSPSTNESVEYEGEQYSKNAPIPLFRRTRTVRVLEDGTMKCDGEGGCYQYETSGLPCEHQGAVCKLVHSAKGEQFPGFLPRDLVARWHTDFMHLAYRPLTEVDKQRQQLYHRLACSNIGGPKLRCDISDEIPIEKPSPKMSAVDRLKNYTSAEVDIEGFDGLVTTTFASASNKLTEEEESDMFDEMNSLMRESLLDSREATFSTSIDDSVLPPSLGVSARSALNQVWQECCDVADNRGSISELKESLDLYLSKSKVSEKRASSKSEHEQPSKKAKHVAMTNAPYLGDAGRVKNTHHMRFKK